MTIQLTAPAHVQEQATRRRGTVRTPLLLLTLLPPLAMGAAWLLTTTTSQASSDRTLILQGARQITNAFGQRMLDLQETTGLPLTDAELQATAQVRAQETLQQSTLPITNVAVFSVSGDTLIAYNDNVRSIDPDDPSIVPTWEKNNPDALKVMQSVAQRTFDDLKLATDGYVGTVEIGNQPLTVLSSTVPGGEAVVISTVDTGYVTRRVNEGVTRNVLIILVSLLVASVVGSAYASRMIRRIKTLALATAQVSDGDMAVEIPHSGTDEISVLSDAIERMKDSLEIGLNTLNR